MEPSSNADYGKLEYWDRRYTEEEHYDWFPSVYAAAVAACFSAIESVYAAQHRTGACSGVLKVLHLGTGNSSLCADLCAAYEAAYPNADARPYRLVQVATDYSTVVIEHMREKYSAERALADVHWAVADIRDLAEVRAQYGPYFDVVLDKGTMDALQADKEREDRDDDIDRMLVEVSRCVEGDAAAPVHRAFVQITWEIPSFRLHYTTRNPTHTFAWGTDATYRLLGDSDMYRVYTYAVSPPPSA